MDIFGIYWLYKYGAVGLVNRQTHAGGNGLSHQGNRRRCRARSDSQQREGTQGCPAWPTSGGGFGLQIVAQLVVLRLTAKCPPTAASVRQRRQLALVCHNVVDYSGCCRPPSLIIGREETRGRCSCRRTLDIVVFLRHVHSRRHYPRRLVENFRREIHFLEHGSCSRTAEIRSGNLAVGFLWADSLFLIRWRLMVAGAHRP